jgi:chromosome segregation ATPase
MSTKPDRSFRTATLGGFLKEDVVSYLQQSAERHAAELDAARALTAKSEAEREKLRADITTLTAEIARLLNKQKNLEETLAVREASLAGAQKELASAMRQLDDADAIAEQLRVKCSQLETRMAEQAEEFNNYSDFRAVIREQEELAHRRADTIRNEALQHAERVRSEVARAAEDACARITAAVKRQRPAVRDFVPEEFGET